MNIRNGQQVSVLQSVENVWECANSEESEGKQAEWNSEW